MGYVKFRLLMLSLILLITIELAFGLTVPCKSFREAYSGLGGDDPLYDTSSFTALKMEEFNKYGDDCEPHVTSMFPEYDYVCHDRCIDNTKLLDYGCWHNQPIRKEHECPQPWYKCSEDRCDLHLTCEDAGTKSIQKGEIRQKICMGESMELGGILCCDGEIKEDMDLDGVFDNVDNCKDSVSPTIDAVNTQAGNPNRGCTCKQIIDKDPSNYGEVVHFGGADDEFVNIQTEIICEDYANDNNIIFDTQCVPILEDGPINVLFVPNNFEPNLFTWFEAVEGFKNQLIDDEVFGGRVSIYAANQFNLYPEVDDYLTEYANPNYDLHADSVRSSKSADEDEKGYVDFIKLSKPYENYCQSKGIDVFVIVSDLDVPDQGTMGCANNYLFVSLTSSENSVSTSKTLIHEFGHNLCCLFDGYVDDEQSDHWDNLVSLVAEDSIVKFFTDDNVVDEFFIDAKTRNNIVKSIAKIPLIGYTEQELKEYMSEITLNIVTKDELGKLIMYETFPDMNRQNCDFKKYVQDNVLKELLIRLQEKIGIDLPESIEELYVSDTSCWWEDEYPELGCIPGCFYREEYYRPSYESIMTSYIEWDELEIAICEKELERFG